MRFAVYARYSSDLQRDASIEDQIRLCREKVAQLGGQVVQVFEDRSISGTRIDSRPGMMALIAAVKAKQFDVVIAEAMDRLSRDLGETDRFYKILAHRGVRFMTLSEGDVNRMHVSFKGLMNDQFLQDLGDKVKRGQRGRVEAGRAGGGISYGYRKVVEVDADGDIENGKRAIVSEQAATICRIFQEYAAGRSPRAIAAGLNRDGIPSPRGGQWNASSINGHPQRHNGILQNRLYAGLLVYGRHTYKKDPETGAREIRVVAQDQRVTKPVPELRIVPPDLWDRAQLRRNAQVGHRPHEARRPKHLLSGLLRCGTCGGAFTIQTTARVGCNGRRERGNCDNNHTITLAELERRVLTGLKTRMFSPAVVSEFLREYRAAMKEAVATRSDRTIAVDQALGDVRKRIGRIVDAIEAGTAGATLTGRLTELEAQRARLEEERAALDAPDVIDLQTDLTEQYARQVADLETALENQADRTEATETLRRYIERIDISPGARRGETIIDVEGRWAAVLCLDRVAEAISVNGSMESVVPREGTVRYHNLPRLRLRV